jgi:hypothetical protein
MCILYYGGTFRYLSSFPPLMASNELLYINEGVTFKFDELLKFRAINK